MCVYNKYAKILKSIQTYKFFLIYFNLVRQKGLEPYILNYH